MTRQVKVIPHSERSEMAGEMADGTLKVKIAAPAEKGKANDALCTFLAGLSRGTTAFHGAASLL